MEAQHGLELWLEEEVFGMTSSFQTPASGLRMNTYSTVSMVLELPPVVETLLLLRPLFPQ